MTIARLIHTEQSASHLLQYTDSVQDTYHRNGHYICMLYHRYAIPEATSCVVEFTSVMPVNRGHSCKIKWTQTCNTPKRKTNFGLFGVLICYTLNNRKRFISTVLLSLLAIDYHCLSGYKKLASLSHVR